MAYDAEGRTIIVFAIQLAKVYKEGRKIYYTYIIIHITKPPTRLNTVTARYRVSQSRLANVPFHATDVTVGGNRLSVLTFRTYL